MKPLKRSRMGRYERGELGAVGHRLLALSLAVSPAVLVLMGACSSEPQGINVARGGDGGGGTDVPIPEDDPRFEQCGSDGILCGEGCCPAGNTCSRFGRCIPDAECTDGSECSSDS